MRIGSLWGLIGLTEPSETTFFFFQVFSFFFFFFFFFLRVTLVAAKQRNAVRSRRTHHSERRRQNLRLLSSFGASLFFRRNRAILQLCKRHNERSQLQPLKQSRISTFSFFLRHAHDDFSGCFFRPRKLKGFVRFEKGKRFAQRRRPFALLEKCCRF